jgi:hypothetical protein
MVCFGFEEAVNREGAEGFVRGEEGKEWLSAGSAKEKARAMSNKDRRETFSERTLRFL